MLQSKVIKQKALEYMITKLTNADNIHSEAHWEGYSQETTDKIKEQYYLEVDKLKDKLKKLKQ